MFPNRDDERKKRGGRSGLSQFGQQLSALRGGARSFMGVGSGGGQGSSGFAFNRKQAPMMTPPARPATGGVFAPNMPQAPSMPQMDFTESDFVPDIASQAPPSQTSPVSQPPMAPVSSGPVSSGGMPAYGGQQPQQGGMPGGMASFPPQRPQLPSWMTAANPRPPGMPDWMFQKNPVPPGMGNIPRQL